MENGDYVMFDRSGRALALIEVARSDGERFGGRIKEDHMPSEVRAVFARHEEIVNQGIFSLLDEAETAIEDLGIVLRPSTGQSTYRVRDVQIMSGGQISFVVIP